jgi:hypothetical protein
MGHICFMLIDLGRAEPQIRELAKQQPAHRIRQDTECDDMRINQHVPLTVAETGSGAVAALAPARSSRTASAFTFR